MTLRPRYVVRKFSVWIPVWCAVPVRRETLFERYVVRKFSFWIPVWCAVRNEIQIDIPMP